MDKEKWKILDSSARKWIKGWVAVVKKDLEQIIVHSDEFDDSMILYYIIPQFLTKEQFLLTNAGKEINVYLENESLISNEIPIISLGRHDFPLSNESTQSLGNKDNAMV